MKPVDKYDSTWSFDSWNWWIKRGHEKPLNDLIKGYHIP